MAQASGTNDRNGDIAPFSRPAKVGVACAVLLIAGTLIPLLAVLVIGMLAMAYGGGGGGGTGELGGYVAPYLIVAVYGSYLAARVYRGEGAARWAGIGFMLLVASLNAGQLADGHVNPLGFMTVVAAIGIVVLCDPAVRRWCRDDDRSALRGTAQVTSVVGLEMAFGGVRAGSDDGGVTAGLQAVAGLVLVGLAIALHYGAPKVWAAVCALMLLQPLFYVGLGDAPERADLLTAGARLTLGGYIVFALLHSRVPRAQDEALTTSIAPDACGPSLDLGVDVG